MILFLKNDLEQAKNLKLVLCAFENLSSLKINFHINELFCFSEASEIAQEYVALFGCKEDNTPFRYSHSNESSKTFKQGLQWS